MEARNGATRGHLDVNSCSEQELCDQIGDQVDGTGAKPAAALVSSREADGPFLDVQDIQRRRLRKIGPAKLKVFAGFFRPGAA